MRKKQGKEKRDRPPHPWSRRMRQERLARGLSEEQLARWMASARGTVRNLEKGGGTVAMFLHVCSTLGLDPAKIASRPVP